jgi:PAS domain S-box-containing protein
MDEAHLRTSIEFAAYRKKMSDERDRDRQALGQVQDELYQVRKQLEHETAARRKSDTELQWWKDIFERIETGVVIGDSKANAFEFSNPSFARMHGFTPDELIGTPISEMFSPREAEKLPGWVRTAEEKGQVTFESVHRRKDGSTFPVLINSTVIRDEDGNTQHRVATAIDLTDLMEARSALRLSERRFEALAETAPVGIFRTDRSGRCIYVNKQWCQIAGMSRRQAMGDGWNAALHPEDRESITRKWNDAAIHREPFQGEYRFIGENGEPTWVLGQAAPETNGDTEIVGFVGTITDISDRKQAEIALREAHSELGLKLGQRGAELADMARILADEVAGRHIAEEELARFSNVSLDMLCIASPDGYFKRVNPAFTRTLGYTDEELLSRPFIDFLHPDDIERTKKEFARLLAGNDVLNYEDRYRTKSGEWRWLSWSSPAPTANDSWIYAVARDVTEIKKAEQALKRREIEARVLYQSTVIAAESDTLDEALQECLNMICAATAWPIGHVYYVDQSHRERLIPSKIWRLADPDRYANLKELTEQTYFERGEGLPGLVLEKKKAAYFVNIPNDDDVLRTKHSAEIGIKWAFGFPIIVNNQVEAVLEFFSPEPLEQDQHLLDIATNIGSQIGRAVERRRALDELTASEERYRELFENSADLIQSVAPDGGFLYVNPAWQKTFGYGEEEVPDLNMIDVIHPDSRAHCVDLFQRLMGGEDIGKIEAKFRAKDGRTIILEGSASCGFRDGEPVAARGIFHDVTERTRYEQALRAIVEETSSETGEDFFRSLVRNLSAAAEVTCAYVSEYLDTGKTRARTLALLIHDGFVENVDYDLANTPCQLVSDGRRVFYANSVQEAFPEDEWLGKVGAQSYHGFPFFDSSGSPIGHLAVIDDRPRQEDPSILSIIRIFSSRAGAEIERQRSRVEIDIRDRAIQAAGNGVVIAAAEGPNHFIVFVNDAYTRITGYSAEEAFGRDSGYLLRDDVDQPGLSEIYSAFSEGRDGSGLVRNYRKDGTVFWNDLHISPVRDAEGKVSHFVGIMNDITERMRTEEVLRERTTDLASVNSELESFSYSVSHDLRAPLRHIDGYSKILESELGDRLSEGEAETLARIRSRTQDMARLIDSLLDLSRIGRQDLNLTPTDLNALVQNVLAGMIDNQDSREIEWDIGDLPTIRCDPELIKLVFANLLSNAVKYSRPRKFARVQVQRIACDGTPVICVRDNGVGFDMKNADTLFGVFQRLHRKEDFDGVGIGLATVHRIIRRHGGRIWAESSPDRGAAFYISI